VDRATRREAIGADVDFEKIDAMALLVVGRRAATEDKEGNRALDWIRREEGEIVVVDADVPEMADATPPPPIDAIEAILTGFNRERTVKFLAMEKRDCLIPPKDERNDADIASAVFRKRITGGRPVRFDFEAELVSLARRGKRKCGGIDGNWESEWRKWER
jgi:hypothetical protein